MNDQDRSPGHVDAPRRFPRLINRWIPAAPIAAAPATVSMPAERRGTGDNEAADW